MNFFELLAWKKTDWDFVGKRRIAFAFSTLLVLSGVVAGVQIIRGRARLGVDFSGGISVTASLGNPVDPDAVRQAFVAAGEGEASIQKVDGGSGRRILIRMREAPIVSSSTLSPSEMSLLRLDPKAGATLISSDASVHLILARVPNGGTVLIEGVQEVGPAVGRQLQIQAAWAVVWAVLLITIYIWIRFEVRFGVAAAIATAHDVFAVLGAMWLLGYEFDILIVTALLTLAGYSLTDTVVVYDRIRESLRLHPADDLDTNVNRSINEVLSRTALTSITTAIPLIALLVYGSPVTHAFSLALICGVVVGTYSSWYVAASILVEWEHARRRRAVAAANARYGQKR